MSSCDRPSRPKLLTGRTFPSHRAAWLLVLAGMFLTAGPANPIERAGFVFRSSISGASASVAAGVGSSPKGRPAGSPAPAVNLSKCTGNQACAGINPNLVGDGSCNGDYACYVAAGPIGAGACNGSYACYATSSPVGDSSCVGLRACYNYVFVLQAVASNACNGDFACEETHGSVGAGSCNSAYSCFRAGGPVGAGSCNASSACENTGSSVGNYSCNGSLACYFASGAIGDCLFNATPPAPCVVDVAGTSVDAPAPSSSILGGVPFAWKATFTNNGSGTLTNVPVRFRVVGPAPSTAEVYNQTTTIATLAGSGGSAQATFPAGAIPTAGSYTASARAEQPGDTVSANDQSSGSFTVAVVGSVSGGSGPNAPLRLAKSPGLPAKIDLSWGATCGTAGNDYAVYEGTLGSWTSHVPSQGCTTLGAFSFPGFGTISADAYYLVVPFEITHEGSYGQRSSGAEIPPSAAPCRGSQALASCP